MRYLRACLDPRTLAVLIVGGVAVAILAPGLVGLSLPLLVVIACPLSMAAMMWQMRPRGRTPPPERPTGDPYGDVRRELADLGVRQRQLEADLDELEGGGEPADTLPATGS